MSERVSGVEGFSMSQGAKTGASALAGAPDEGRRARNENASEGRLSTAEKPKPLTLEKATDVLRALRRQKPAGLSATEAAIWAKFLLHADAEGVTWVRASTIAREAGRDVQTVRRAIRRFRELGIMTSTVRVTDYGRENLYQLHEASAHAAPTPTRRARALAMDASAFVRESHRVVLTRGGRVDELVEVTLVAPENDAPTFSIDALTNSRAAYSTAGGGAREPLSDCILCEIQTQHDRRDASELPAPPPPAPYSDQTHRNDPSVSPRRRGEKHNPRSLVQQLAARVLVYFQRVLWPQSRGEAVTSERARVVEKRIRDLARWTERDEIANADELEQLLRDAIDGARLSTWHSGARVGFHLRFVLGNCDTIEELAALTRARRRARAAPETAPPNPKNHARTLPPAKEISIPADQMVRDIEQLFASPPPNSQRAEHAA